MPKSRGRKRYTRKVRSAWKKRRPCTRRNGNKRRSTRRSTRRNTRMHGGRTNDPTEGTVEGMPVTAGALISIPGKGIYDIKAFKQHEKDMDFQGPGATGYN